MADERFYVGADVSFLDEIEEGGFAFSRGDGPEDALRILKEAGMNLIRLRVWNEPEGGYCNAERTAAMAERAAALGMSLLIDFHYSDWWADPGKQHKPAAWRGLHFDGLCLAVHEFTAETLREMARRGAAPHMVQVGNEITPGMLWDDGRVDGPFDTPEQWAKLARLLEAGASAVRSEAPSAQVMLHIDRGGDNAGARRFFDQMARLGVDYDWIGLSYYPWWHGPLEALKENLDDLALRYGKPILLAETAYPWTLRSTDRVPNIVGSPEQLHPGYPATVEGQGAFLREVTRIVRRTPGGLGRGVVYWEPVYVSTPKTDGSPWENLTLFDEEGRALPSLQAFGGAGR